MRPYKLFQIVLLFVLMSGCEVIDPVKIEDVLPALSEPVVPDSLYLGTDSGIFISVRASDPQGVGDLETVQCLVYPFDNRTLILRDTLADDGLNGDIIPADGLYVGRIKGADIGNRIGSYWIGFLAIDRDQHASDTLFAPFQVVSTAPDFGTTQVPDTIYQENLKSVSISISVTDPNGLLDVDSVYFDVYPPFSSAPIARLTLRDDGTQGDAVAQDGIYSFSGDMSSFLNIPGMYSFRFQAKDKGGFLSQPVVANVPVAIPNDPPMLTMLSAPDSISRNLVMPHRISIFVQDPQGLADIKRVYFNTTKPDNTPSSGNPFTMYDDGSHGDIAAGDGTYSLEITISPQNALGEYRFDFYAEDLSGAMSPSVRHVITVVDDILL
jgi:hypothetical protein